MFSVTLRPAPVPVHHDESDSSACSCERPAAEHFEPSTLLWAFAAGVGVWPVADVVRLCKLALQRHVAAAEWVLLVRAPDRP